MELVYHRLPKEGETETKEHKIARIEDTGYALLGVFAHALTDVYAHRAKVPVTMVCKNSTTLRSSSVFKSSYDKCYVGKDCISKSASTVYSGINGTEYTNLSSNRAFEDNPYFWSYRYSKSVSELKAKINEMKEDGDNTNTYSFTNYSEIPLK